MHLFIGADHRGVELRDFLQKKLRERGHTVSIAEVSDENEIDYPDIASAVAEGMKRSDVDYSVLICGTGNGMNIMANRYPHIRSALCWNVEVAKLARKHNNANVITLPALFLHDWAAEAIVMEFLSTEFEGGRHLRRILKIDKLVEVGNKTDIEDRCIDADSTSSCDGIPWKLEYWSS